MPDTFFHPCLTWRSTTIVLMVLATVLTFGPPASAQPTDPASDTISTGELEALVETLESPERREELLTNLRSLIEVQRGEQAPDQRDTGGNLLSALSAQVEEVGRQVLSAAEFAVNLPGVWTWTRDQLLDPASRDRWIEVVVKILVVITAGIVLEWIVRWLLARPRRAIENRENQRLVVRIPFLVVHTLLEILPIAAFAAAAYSVLPLLDPSPLARVAILAIINANVLVRLVAVVARMILEPEASSLRIASISTETANYLYIWVRRIASMAIYGYFLLEVLRLIGMPLSAHTVLLKLLGLLVTGFLVVFILQNKTSVASFLRGTSGSRRGAMGMLRARLADVWHVFAIAYVLGAFFIWALQVDGGFEFLFRATLLTGVIVLAAQSVSSLVKHGLRRGFAINSDLRQRFPGLEEHANRYLPTLQIILLGIVWLIAALAILQAWGIDSFAWMVSDFGRQVLGSTTKIVAVLFLSVLAWELIRASIDRYLSKTDADGNIVERTARAKTLLPLLQRVALIVLAVIAGLVVLSEVGIDIGPLLAGAGIIGLAVGFGAQTLVKDVITGMFILVEDHFTVGDVVTVAGRSGVVEAISIRTIRLRDLSGTVHTIPFSEVTATENLTKDFSYYLMHVRVAYREDTDYVVEVLQGVAREMEEDPAYKSVILPPFEVHGVNEFDESAVVIRCAIKTVPMEQWAVGREFNRRMKKRFDELGIEMPRPHRVIYFGEDKAGYAPPVRVTMEGVSREIAAPAEPDTPVAEGIEDDDRSDSERRTRRA